MPKNLPSKINALPRSPGVYQFVDHNGRILYVGKATFLKERVKSYFTRPLEQRLEAMLSQITDVRYIKTDSVIEALILESNLIQKYNPPYNIRAKDDKTFAQIAISDETFPRILITRPTKINPFKIKYRFGPYTSTEQARSALKIIRKIFSFRTACKVVRDDPERSRGTTPRGCLDYQLGLCPGSCTGKLDPRFYRKTIRKIILFLQGKKQSVEKTLIREMKKYSHAKKYEEAAQLRNQLFAIRHIQDIALLKEDQPELNVPLRIEGYDISNIGADYAVGSMVVFQDGLPAKDEYRKFRIKTTPGINDIGMMGEVLERRVKHLEWPRPDLILLDGGEAHLRSAGRILRRTKYLAPLVSIAKGPARERNDFYYADQNTEGLLRANPVLKKILIRVRDEAHRFAIRYHRALRDKQYELE